MHNEIIGVEMTTIYFIRHAEPLRSADSIYNDRTYPLSQKGLADRFLVTEYLLDKNIDIVLSSPFKRAVDTISDFAGKIGCEIELIEDFRERAISNDWIDDFKGFAKKQWADFTYKLDGGESLSEVQERNVCKLHDVLARYKEKNIVIGTHGQALSLILNHYDDAFGFDDFMEMAHIMPWVVKMDFNECDCIRIEKIDLFKQYTK